MSVLGFGIGFAIGWFGLQLLGSFAKRTDLNDYSGDPTSRVKRVDYVHKQKPIEKFEQKSLNISKWNCFTKRYED